GRVDAQAEFAAAPQDVVCGHGPLVGTHFGADLYQAEVDYLRAHEWAVTADDILWRRSKLGLRIDAAG
ncbi:hypothetical protein, partial [Xanthomonas arboricola]|uniref:hypothetical protein n=1 Tax=Xanthomonas arboricola TaxID=56448 RepID=UPI000D45F490